MSATNAPSPSANGMTSSTPPLRSAASADALLAVATGLRGPSATGNEKWLDIRRARDVAESPSLSLSATEALLAWLYELGKTALAGYGVGICGRLIRNPEFVRILPGVVADKQWRTLLRRHLDPVEVLVLDDLASLGSDAAAETYATLYADELARYGLVPEKLVTSEQRACILSSAALLCP